MKKLTLLMMMGMMSSSVFAENIEVMLSNQNMSYAIDKDSIEKVGQYYQALLIRKTKKPEVINGLKHDQTNSVFKFNCMNNSNYMARITTYYQGKLVKDEFNPRPEKLEKDDSGMTEEVCKNYLSLY